MRFLTAYFSTLEGCDIVLTGSERMQERPIGVLVEALQALGAEIDYVKTKGYPPLHIKGKLQEVRFSFQQTLAVNTFRFIVVCAKTLKWIILRAHRTNYLPTV